MLAMLSLDDPELYRSVLDDLTAGVYPVDRTGKIVFWNAGAERIRGFARTR
jgi:PAS domain S-box-containing protein